MPDTWVQWVQGNWCHSHCRADCCVLSSNVCSVASVVSDSPTPWTMAHQAPLSMGFSWKGYWSGLAFPSPEDLSNQESNPCLLRLLWILCPWAIGEVWSSLYLQPNATLPFTLLELVSLLFCLHPQQTPMFHLHTSGNAELELPSMSL